MKVILPIAIAKSMLFALFLLLPNIYMTAENQQKDILTDSRKLLQENGGNNVNAASVIERLDSLIQTGSYTEREFITVINRAGSIFRQQGQLIHSIEIYLKTVAYYRQINYPSREQIQSLVQCYIPLGASHDELGLWNRATEFYFDALALAEEYDFEVLQAMLYNNIGNINYNRHEWEKAEEYLLKAIAINKKNNIKRELYNNYNNLAGVYNARQEYDQSLDCALQAIQLLDKNQDADLYYSMYSNIASVYILKGDYQLAITYLQNAIVHQIQSDFSSDLIHTYVSLAEVYEKTGKRDSTAVYLNKSLQQAEKLNNKHIESQILYELAAFYERNRNYEKAYRTLTQSTQIKDSIEQEDNRQKMIEVERMYSSEKQIREKELLIKDITVQKLASDRLWLITASIALLLILLLGYFINRTKQKDRKEQLQKQKEIELNQMIDQKNRELTSYTLTIIKNNEFISDMKEELKQLFLTLNPRDKENKEKIRELINKLSYQNSTDNWEEFSYYFEKVHPSFYSNLEQTFPELTLKEKRLCAFLKLGLSTKEISAITFKEVRSVESARNRLRKKLGVLPEGNLTEFLENLRL